MAIQGVWVGLAPVGELGFGAEGRVRTEHSAARRYVGFQEQVGHRLLHQSPGGGDVETYLKIKYYAQVFRRKVVEIPIKK